LAQEHRTDAPASSLIPWEPAHFLATGIVLNRGRLGDDAKPLDARSTIRSSGPSPSDASPAGWISPLWPHAHSTMTKSPGLRSLTRATYNFLDS
jgi:hypothetical protein